MSIRFWRLLSASTISTLGDHTYAIALPIVLLTGGYSPALVTVLYGTTMGATVLGSLWLGGLADRYPFRRLLSTVYLGTGVVLTVLAATADRFTPGAAAAALAGAVVLGCGAGVSAASVDVAVPQVMGGGSRPASGYSLVESARVAANVAGAALAGFVATGRGVSGAMFVNALSFFLAALLLFGIGRPGGAGREGRAGRRDQVGSVSHSGESGDAGPAVLEGSADGPAPTARPASSGRKRFAVTEGLALVWRQPALRHGLTLSFLVNVLTGAEAPLLVTRLVEDLGLAAQAASGLIAVATLAGIVLAALAARLARALATRTVMTAAATAIGVAAAGVGATTSIPVLIGAYCVLGGSMIAYNVQWRVYRQEVTGGERLGQVSATCRSVAYIGVVIGVAAVSLLQGRGAGTAVLFVGSGLLCVAVVAVLGVLRPGGAEIAQEHPVALSELREGGR